MAFSSRKRNIIDNSAVNTLFAPEKLQGTKWQHHSTGRTGFNTIMDRDIIADHMKTEKRNMGNGFLKLQIPDYNPANPTAVNIGGRLMYPDKDGVLTIIDESVVNKMASIEEEKRQYVEKLIEKASLSDEICALVLGVKDQNELKKLLDVGGDAGEPQLADSLKAVNAMPSALETYDPTSITYSQAIQKFKICVKTLMPIMDNLTPASTINQEQ